MLRLFLKKYYLSILGYLQQRNTNSRLKGDTTTSRKSVRAIHILLRLVHEKCRPISKSAAAAELANDKQMGLYKHMTRIPSQTVGTNKAFVGRVTGRNGKKGKENGLKDLTPLSYQQGENEEYDPFRPFITTTLTVLSSATNNIETRDLAVNCWHDLVHMISIGTAKIVLYPMVVSLLKVLRDNEKQGHSFYSSSQKSSSVRDKAIRTLHYLIVSRLNIASNVDHLNSGDDHSVLSALPYRSAPELTQCSAEIAKILKDQTVMYSTEELLQILKHELNKLNLDMNNSIEIVELKFEDIEKRTFLRDIIEKIGDLNE